MSYITIISNWIHNYIYELFKTLHYVTLLPRQHSLHFFSYFDLSVLKISVFVAGWWMCVAKFIMFFKVDTWSHVIPWLGWVKTLEICMMWFLCFSIQVCFVIFSSCMLAWMRLDLYCFVVLVVLNIKECINLIIVNGVFYSKVGADLKPIVCRFIYCLLMLAVDFLHIFFES